MFLKAIPFSRFFELCYLIPSFLPSHPMSKSSMSLSKKFRFTFSQNDRLTSTAKRRNQNKVRKIVRSLHVESLERRELMAANVFNDQFNLTNGSIVYSPAISLNVLANDNNGAVTQQVSSANIDYTNPNKGANTATYSIPVRPSSSVPQRSMIVGGIALGNVTNYADIALSKDSDTLDNGTASLSLMARTEGIVIATVRENITPNLPGNTATNLAVLNYNNEATNVQLSSEAGPANDGENIVRPGVARFPFSANWIGGSYSSTGTAVVSHPSISVATTSSTGQYQVSIQGVTDSRAEGFLFVMASGNSDNYARALPIGGSSWLVNTRDNAGNFASGEAAAFSVLYVPRSAQGLVGGVIRGDSGIANPVIQSFGDFSIQRTSNGNWNMSIPGQSPTTGVLIIETADQDRARATNSYFSYQAAANGTDFAIRQLQFESATAANSLNDDFVVLFVPFENQLATASPLTVSALGTAGSPSSGTSANGVALTVNADKTINYAYTPEQLRALGLGQTVTDTFVYTATDGTNSNTATVTVTLRGSNDTPVIAAAIPPISFVEDDAAQTINLGNYFTDYDANDTVTYTITLSADAPVDAVIVGSNLTFTPKSDRSGAFSYTIKATDSSGLNVTSAVAVGSISSVVDGAKAVNDNATTTKDTAININVLANDFDPENAVGSVGAANISGNIDATSNATTVWSTTQTSSAPNNLNVIAVQDLGDVQLTQNGVNIQQSTGVLLATVADDTTPFGTANSYGNILNATSGYWLATDTGTGTGGERNTPMGAAFFPYSDGWTSGHVDNTGILRSGFGVSQTNVTRIAAGLFEVTIPEASNSETSGYLFAMTSSNDDNIMSVRPIPGTNRWQVRNTDNDNASDTAGVANLEDDGFSFVYVPATTANLVSGRWAIDSGTGIGSLVQSSGGVTATMDAAGTVTVTVPGQSPTTGTLIAIGSGGASASVAGNSIVLPANLAVSYVASGSNFSIRLRSGGTFTQAIGDVQFLFLPFANALERLAPNPYSVTSASATSTLGAAITINSNGTIKYDPSAAGGSIAALNPGESLVDSFTYTITDSNGRTSTATANVTVTGDRVVVSPFTGLVTTEAGGTAQFSVSLAVPPVADVTIAFLSSDETEGLLSVASITFTSANWNTPQFVTITGVDDAFVDGNVAYSIITTATSTDANFNGVSVVDLSVVNNDNDVAGITVTPTTGLVTTERGGTASFSVVLTSQPAANVVIPLSSSNTSEGTISSSSITFTPTNWNVPQVVTVTGVDDALVDADVAYSVVTDAAVSTDPNYSGRNPANVSVVNTNFDIGATTSSGMTQYGTGSIGIGIDGRLAFPGTSAFLTNGTLTVTVTGNANTNDRLELRNEGTGAGQVGVSGTDVTYAGVVIGSFAGGSGVPLLITFNAAATRVSAQAVARAVTYRDVTVNGSGTRTVSFALVDGGGQTSPVVSKTVNISLKRVYEIQEGVDRGFGAYVGAKDIQLAQASPNTAFPTGGDANGLLVDYPDSGATNTAQVLMRFDSLFGNALGQIPAGAIITSASLFLQTNNTGDGAEFHRMLTDWNATTSTWNSVGGGIQNDGVQARSTYDSFWNTQDTSGATGTGYASVAVTNDIRAWNAGATNFGWVLSPFAGGTDGWAFSPSETADATIRPMLKIEWVPAGTTSVVFQQGLNGYNGAVDTQLFQALPTVNYGAQESIGSDYEDAGGTNRTQALIRFEDIMGSASGRIPANARIDQAVLTVVNGGNNAVGHGGTFNAMLADWNADSTWDSMVNGISANGIEASSVVTTQAGNSSLNPLAQGGINDFEVTSDVQNWVRGTANKGWAILPWTNGSDGWFLYSSDYNFSPAFRPQLQVFFTELPNNAPTDMSLSPAKVDENLPVDTVVGTLSSVDPDAGNTFTYELVTGTGDTDNNAFKIVNGQVLTNATFDFETKSTYTIRVRTTDQGGQQYSARSFEKAITITIGNVNDIPPVVTTASSVLSYSGSPVAVDSSVTVVDDGTSLVGATVRVSTGYLSTEDVLSFVNTSTITGTFDSQTGVLTLTGTDSLVNYQTALRSVLYSNTNANPATTQRTVTFRVDDGAAANNLSNEANRDIAVGRSNSNPVVAANSSAVSGNEGTTISNTGTWSDPDAGNVVTLTASAGTIVKNANGTWDWSFASTDQVAATTVTITANDGVGGTASTTFTYTVNNVAPVLTRANATVTGNVGTSLTNTGTYADVPADTVTLTADIGTVVKNNDGTWSWSFTPASAVSNQVVTITGSDEDGGSSSVTFTFTSNSTVATRGVRYLGATGSSASTSLATDKVALLPGQASTFANYTNYSRGLNGIVVDVNGLPAGTTNAQMLSSLQFDQWDGIAAAGFVALSGAAVPNATIIRGGGAAGSDSVAIAFPDNTVQNTWLRVTVLANADTGLAANDVFYFGNVIGDFNTGNTSTRYRVNALDTSAVRNNQSPGANSASVTNIYDVNRDGRVNALDTSIVRNNQQSSGIVAPITAPSSRAGRSSFGRSSSAIGGSTVGSSVPFTGVAGKSDSQSNSAAAGTDSLLAPNQKVLGNDLLQVGVSVNSSENKPVDFGSTVDANKEPSKLESIDDFFASLWDLA
jgi:VCBS repeat-containing protein